MKKTICLLCAVCLCLGGVTACESYDNFISAFFKGDDKASEEKAETVKIGVFEPLSGDDREAAADEIRGIELAHELYPRVLGMPVELVYGDNHSDDTYAPQAAKDLTDQGVSVVLGSYRNVLSLAGADVFRETRTPAITVSCTNPLITQSNYYYSRVCFIDADQGRSAAEYAVSVLGTDWVTVFVAEGDDYSSTMAEQFISAVEEKLGNSFSAVTLTFPRGTDDFTYYLGKLNALGSGAVFFPCSAELGQEVIWQADKLGYDFNWIGCSKWSELGTAAAASGRTDLSFADGVCYVADYSAGSSLTPMTETLRSAYCEKYGDQLPSKACALGFDAYLLAIEAIEQAGSSSSGTLIANKILNISEFEGATGRITMNADGDPMKDVVINMLSGGQNIAACTVTPGWGE